MFLLPWTVIMWLSFYCTGKIVCLLLRWQPDSTPENTEVKTAHSSMMLLNRIFSVIDIKLEKQPEMTVTESSCSC